jgi:hypothetical protein
MKLPDPQTVNPVELIESLRMSADIMIRIDGDRDYGNKSNLTAGQVRDAFRLMLIAADAIDLWRDRCESTLADAQRMERSFDEAWRQERG